MAKNGVNKVILVGRLGQNPELRASQKGVSVVALSLATSETWKDKQTGEPREQTEWHRLVFYSKLAEVAHAYLKKGAKIFVEGKLQTRKWQDASGLERQSTEIVVEEMLMLDKKGSEVGDGQPGASRRTFGSAEEGFRNPASKPAISIEDFEDDIPF